MFAHIRCICNIILQLEDFMIQETTLKGFRLRIKASNSNVTGTCYHLELFVPGGKTEEYLVDCGLFLEDDTLEYNGVFLFNPKKIRAILLTHYHVDHYGQIPIVYEQGFCGKVYSSEHTIENLKGKAMSNFFSERRARPEKPNYSEETTVKMIQNAQALAYEKEYKLSEHVRIKIFPNAHLRGAVMFLVICECEGHKIYTLFTGDYKVSKFPKGLEEYRDVPISIVTEGTYGIQEKPEPVFLSHLDNAFKANHTVIVTATGEGRYDAVLAKLEEAKKKKIIPKDTIIFVEVKRASVDKLNREEKNPYIKYVSRPDEKRLAIYEKRPKVIIVNTRGGVTFFMQEMVSREKVTIFFTNYIAPANRARIWINSSKQDEIRVGKESFIKHAKIIEVRDFCGHAFAEDIGKFLNNFTNIIGLFIGHGDKEAKRALVPYLAKYSELDRNIVFVLRRNIEYDLMEKVTKYYK